MPPKKKSKAALKTAADDEIANEENERKDEVEDVTMPPKKKSKAALKTASDDEIAKEENERKDEVEDVTMPPKKKSKAALKTAADDERAKEENERKDEVEDVTMPPKKKSKADLKKASDDERAKEENERKDEAKDDDGEEEDDDDEINAEEHGRGKRKRRESKNYEPDDFTMKSSDAATKASTVLEGRGEKLGEIATVKASMTKYKLNSDEFSFAYKFVFSNRGIANKKLMKEKLLDFSGYLPPLPKGKYNKERQEEEDEVVETKYATKAFKMNVSQIKALCTFFSVDYSGEDGKPLNKDDIIDRLLDFLGAPDESLVKEKESSGTKKKPAAKSKKKTATKKITAKRKSVARKVTEDPFSLIKDYKKGKVPSDDAIRQWVKAYIVCVDMETATTKDAILTATAKFGVQMADKKARIKQYLAEEI